MNQMFGKTAAGTIVLCCAASLLTGCSANQFVSAIDNSPVAGAALQGKVHGAQQPIIGATVQLWAVGATGYGSAATKLGSSVVTIGPGGTFALGAYTCPTAGTQTYITASGGNPGLGSSNPNIMLAEGLGNCGSLSTSTFIFMNEVTTAATAYALGQYFTPAIGGPSSADSFGAPNTTQAQVGIVNASSTVANLVSMSTGNAVTSALLPTGCTTSTTLCLTATPESAKLNTIADVLAACINSAGGAIGDSSACGMLFSGVVTATGTAPTDTLQAAVYMSLNPTSANANTNWPNTCTSNLCTLYGLASGYAQYIGVASQPTDWTVGIQYTAASTTPLLSNPQNIAADAAGNIWIVNNPGSASNGLTELSPTGLPTVNTLTGATAPTFATLNPRNIAIDTVGNVWVPTSSGAGTLFEYTTGGTVNSLALGKGPYGIAIDGSNNVFVGEQSGSATNEIYEFLTGNLSAGYQVGYPAPPGGLNAEYVGIDTFGNLWYTSGTTSITTNYIEQLSNINISSCGTPPFLVAGVPTACAVTSNGTQNTFLQVATGGLLEPWSPVPDATGIWVANTAGNTLTKFGLSGSTITSGNNYGSAASLNSPHFIAVDGSGNVWVANKTSAPGSVAEFTNSGAVLSPGTGFSHAGIASGNAITLDPSGNVWIADNSATTNSVFEIVGAASPTVTPTALALKNSTVGIRP